MKDRHNIVFAIGKFTSKFDFGDCKIYKDFCFNPSSTIKEFSDDVDRLVDIIEKEKIDVIHVHPFYSLFPAVFAAKLTNKPIVYTLHGLASFNFPHMVNDVILSQSILEGELDKTFVVSQILEDVIKEATASNNITLLPNAVDIDVYHKHEVKNNKEWALVSRIVPEKIREIKQIISIMDRIDIKKIYIYGDGKLKQDLQNFIDDNGFNDRVILLGHKDNLNEELNGKYNGVIGIGRTVLEALSMGYPCMLIGYGKIAGIVDKELYNSVKNNNFINKLLRNISTEELKLQVKNIYENNSDVGELYNIIREDFSARKIYDMYEQELSNIVGVTTYDYPRIYADIKKLTKQDKNIYESREVYSILKLYIEQECTSHNLKSYFVNYNNYYNSLDINHEARIYLQNEIEDIQKEIEDIEKDIKDLKEKINSIEEKKKDDIKEIENITEKINQLEKNQSILQDKINIKFLAYNTFHKAKNKKWL